LLHIRGDIVKADRAGEIDAPCGNDRVVLRMRWRAHESGGNGGHNRGEHLGAALTSCSSVAHEKSAHGATVFSGSIYRLSHEVPSCASFVTWDRLFAKEMGIFKHFSVFRTWK